MNLEVRSLAYDSRAVEPGSLFFAIRGEKTDGNLYLDEALRRGAVGVVSERESPKSFPACWIQVGEVRSFMAQMANRFYGHPSREMKLVGITGTNGKTTTTFLVDAVLRQQAPSLLMGTIETRVGNETFASIRTTPESIDIQKILKRAVTEGCRAGVLEVSSHALQLNRVYGCHFPVAVFTNLSPEHLDFHGTLEDYFQAKRRLFLREYNPGLEEAIVNADDPFSRRLDPSPGTRLTTFGLRDAMVFPRYWESSVSGSRLELNFFGRTLSLQSPLVGEHNLYNLMAAATACSRLGISDEAIRDGIASLFRVPGRFEKVDIQKSFTVIVDYAHTPDALENVLRLSRKLANGRVICVFGCGGDRDRSKRPVMGRLAVEMADLALVTSDNPRSEDPERILYEIRSGFPPHRRNFELIVDRRRAIARALEVAKEGDLVLIAGKGHETYQEGREGRIPFDDREVVKELA